MVNGTINRLNMSTLATRSDFRRILALAAVQFLIMFVLVSANGAYASDDGGIKFCGMSHGCQLLIQI